MDDFSCVLNKNSIRVSVCDCAAHKGTFLKHCFNHYEDSLMMVAIVPKDVVGDFVHLLCVYSSECEVGFMSCFLRYARHT